MIIIYHPTLALILFGSKKNIIVIIILHDKHRNQGFLMNALKKPSYFPHNKKKYDNDT